MTVRLIAITKPVIPEVTTTAELLAYCARVSSTANQQNHATGPRLIKSLITREEWSPLEMVNLTMEIVTTRDIARQILRHRSFSFQEFSQRYAEVEDDPVFRQARNQHPTDRQASIEIDKPSAQDDWRRAQERVWREAIAAYRAARKRGMAKEVARTVLPEGMTQSRLYVQGSLRSWWHYTALRMQPGTQAEHREIAEAARAIVLERFPMLSEAAA